MNYLVIVMDFEGLENRGENGKNLAEIEQEARNTASRERIAEKDEAFNLELSGVGNRMERFGVGDASRGSRIEAAKRSKTNDSFYAAAMAQAYAQPVTFRLNGQDVSMSLGDMRKIAQERYDHYAAKSRNSADPKDRERMDAYEQLIRMTDDVAAGAATPEELSVHIEKYDLGQEIAEAGQANPEIKVEFNAPEVAEAAQAGAYADQSASERNAALIAGLFNNP